MVFTKRKTPKFELKLQIDGEDIKEVHKTKFLGVISDNKLTWKEHISYICGKYQEELIGLSRPDTILKKWSLGIVSLICMSISYVLLSYLGFYI